MDRRQLLLSGLAAIFYPHAATAAPAPYTIGPRGAQISYLFNLQGSTVAGTAPLSRADLRIDPTALQNSTAEVTADLRQARTKLFFATEALKSETVLDIARFPNARFVSRRIVLGPDGRISGGAAIEGALTLRGVTRPIRFAADLFRKPGSAPDDLTALDVRLRATINRNEFGASGYPALVAPEVGIDIKADLRAL
ncbi:MAG: YceI family protein [Pseudomonadota bacterium]